MRPRIPVEVCVACEDAAAVERSVRAALLGGAARVELCRRMTAGGLTPAPEHVARARVAAGPGLELVVMIRPRAGGFTCSPAGVARMRAEIAAARRAGADGVALGAVRGRRIDREATALLMAAAREEGLRVTFHRAFDALADPLPAIDELIELGADRVLTGGTPWGHGGGALDGAARLAALIRRAGPRIEVVAAGGVSPANVAALLGVLPVDEGRVSVHAYSGVRRDGVTDRAAVEALVRAAGGG